MFPRHSRPVLALGLALALSLSLGACHKGGDKDKAATTSQAVLTVSTQPASMRVMTHTLELTGSVAAWDTLPVMPATNGLRIMQVLVDEGQSVKQGQLLVKLDDATIRTQLAQARAHLATARANLESAQDTYQRFAELEKEGGVSASDMTTRRVAVDTAEASVAEAKATVAQSEVMLSQTEVRAPEDGLIIKRDAHLGDVAAVGKSLFTMVRDGRLEVDALVAETDIPMVHTGQKVTVSSDAQPGLKAIGTVREVSPAVDVASRQATAKIDLPLGSGFKVGMFVRANVASSQNEVVAVPAQAVLTRESGAQVFVLDGDIAHVRPVVTGSHEGDWVAVQQGLKAGDPVVTSGAGFLKDGDKVDVAPALGENPAASDDPGRSSAAGGQGGPGAAAAPGQAGQ